jgi:hypothetical protein
VNDTMNFMVYNSFSLMMLYWYIFSAKKDSVILAVKIVKKRINSSKENFCTRILIFIIDYEWCVLKIPVLVLYGYLHCCFSDGCLNWIRYMLYWIRYMLYCTWYITFKDVLYYVLVKSILLEFEKIVFPFYL